MLRATMIGKRLLILLTCLGLSCATSAPSPKAPAPASGALGAAPGAFLALSVANLDRVLPWYRDTLGFRVQSEGVAPNRPIRFALLQYEDSMIELLQLPDARPRAEAAPESKDAYQIHGFFKGGFIVADIEAVYERMKRLDVKREFELVQPPNGPYRTFGVRDPEGNLVQFLGR